MATRNNHQHVSIDAAGNRTVVAEQEPLADFNARSVEERVENGIASATTGIGAADTDLAEIDAIVWANNTTAAQVRTQLINCVARQRRIAARQRVIMVVLRNVLRLLLRRFDTIEAE